MRSLMRRALPLLALALLTAGSTGCALSGGALPSARSDSASLDRALSLARLSERHGKLQEAAKLYQGVLRSNPNHPVALHRLGVIAARSGDHTRAMSHFEQARRNGPPTAALLTDIGYTQYLQDDLQAAESSLRAALQLDPQYKKARNNLGLVLGEQGRDEESYAEFRKAGSESAAHANLAYLKSQLGEVNEAERHYHRSLELDGDQRPAAEALIQLAAHRAAYRRVAAGGKTSAQPVSHVAAADPGDVIIEDGRPQGPNADDRAKRAATARPPVRASYASHRPQSPQWAAGPPAMQRGTQAPMEAAPTTQPLQRATQAPMEAARTTQPLQRATQAPMEERREAPAPRWVEGPPPQPRPVEAPEEKETDPPRWVSGPSPQPRPIRAPAQPVATRRGDEVPHAAEDKPDFLVRQRRGTLPGTRLIVRDAPDDVTRSDFPGSEELELQDSHDRLPPLEPLR